LLFHLNAFVFSTLEISTFINWVFIPAGLRLVAVLLFNRNAIVGLFVGALMTSMDSEISLASLIVLSFLSAVNPYIAYKVSNALLKVKSSLIELTPNQLLLMSVMSAFFNTIFHNFYFYFSGLTQEFWMNSVKMFTGDLIGCLIVLYTFSFSIKLVKKSNRNLRF
jgi:hypothetical protein